MVASCCAMSSAGLQHIKGLCSLQHVVLWNCLRLTEGGLTMLASLSRLTHLSLRGCQQLTDTALPHLVALGALRQLNLTACERMAGMWSLLRIACSVCPSVCLSVHACVHPSVCLCLPACLPACLSACLSACHSCCCGLEGHAWTDRRTARQTDTCTCVVCTSLYAAGPGPCKIRWFCLEGVSCTGLAHSRGGARQHPTIDCHGAAAAAVISCISKHAGINSKRQLQLSACMNRDVDVANP